MHNYRCAGCQAESRLWTLIRSCDDQRVVSVADLIVQLLHGCNSPLNARAHTLTRVNEMPYLCRVNTPQQH